MKKLGSTHSGAALAPWFLPQAACQRSPPRRKMRKMKKPESQLGSESGLGAALGCSGLLVRSLFNFNLSILANAAWFPVLAGMATVGCKGGASPCNESKKGDDNADS